MMIRTRSRIVSFIFDNSLLLLPGTVAAVVAGRDEDGRSLEFCCGSARSPCLEGVASASRRENRSMNPHRRPDACVSVRSPQAGFTPAASPP
jgi:hypothetical protein